MQGLYLGLQVFSAYGLIIMNLILLFGAGIQHSSGTTFGSPLI